MSGDKAQLTLLVGDVIYNQETHTNKGEAHEWMPLFVYAHMRVYQRERAFRGSFLFFRSSFARSAQTIISSNKDLSRAKTAFRTHMLADT